MNETQKNDLIWANRILSTDPERLREFAKKIVRESVEWWNIEKGDKSEQKR